MGKVDRYVGSLTFCAAPWGNRIWKGVTIYLYGGKHERRGAESVRRAAASGFLAISETTDTTLAKPAGQESGTHFRRNWRVLLR